MDELSFDFEAEIDTKDALRKASLKADGVVTTADSAATRGRHSMVCKHWMKNLCMKGDKCDFLHQFDPDRMPECMLWLKFGKCTDPDCTFRHVANEDRPECQRYRLGFCRYGLMCRSRHDRLPRESLPDILPDWFLNSLIVNAYLIPRTEDLPIGDLRDRLRHGTVNRSSSELALAPAVAPTEQGTIPGLLPPIHGKCRYFVMRSMNVRNIQISAAKGIWATSLGNSQKLRQSFRDVDHVILIFSATESRTFSGYGKMMCEPDDHLLPGIWGELSCRLSANFRVHWLKQCTAPLGLADHIKNPQNDDLPVRRCRDGQELPSSVGERLCRFLWQQAEVDLVKGSDFEFEPRVSYEHPVPSLKDAADATQDTSKASDSAAPLALEDAHRPSESAALEASMPDDHSRPAPERLGTFSREGRAGGPAPVTVGKALASGSSSLLAAMAEEGYRHGPYGGTPVGWQPPGLPSATTMAPGHGWRPPPIDPSLGMPPPGQFAAPPLHSFGHHHPPQMGGGYGAPPPGGYRPFGHFGGMPAHGGPMPPHPGYVEQPPPGYWGGGGAGAGAGAGERTLGRPPAEWEGASSAVAPLSREGGGGRRRSEPRSRSRRRRRRG